MQTFLLRAITLCLAALVSRAAPVQELSIDEHELFRFVSSPARPPVLTFSSADSSPVPSSSPSPWPADYHLFLGPHGEGLRDSASIYTPQGELVWSSSAYGKVHNLLVQPFGPDHEPHLTFWSGSTDAAAFSTGKGHVVVLDSAYREVLRIRSPSKTDRSDVDLHEFRLSTRGPEKTPTAIVTAQRVVPQEGGGWGPYVVDTCFYELEIATQTPLFSWCPSSHIPRQSSYQFKLVQGLLSWAPYDFFHLNSIDVDAAGNYLVSGRATHSLYLISPEGETLWTLSGHPNGVEFKGDFEVVGEGDASFGWQHHASWVPADRIPGATDEEGVRYISLFDNGSSGFFLLDTRTYSRGLILRVDERARTVKLQAEFLPPSDLEGVPSSSQGSVQVLESGDVLVGFGKAPYLALYAPDGQIKESARLGGSAESYRTILSPWRAAPAHPPSLGVVLPARTAASQAVTTFASWNGATQVFAWRLYGGPSPGSCPSLLAEVRSEGFETRIELPDVPGGLPPWLVVAAVDEDGMELEHGRSEPRPSGSDSSRPISTGPAREELETVFGLPKAFEFESQLTIEPLGTMMSALREWVRGTLGR